MQKRSDYEWVTQVCPICEEPPTKLMGRRGGAAHRQHLGVECEVWSCERCSLIFPNPMPVPINGPNQHYGLAADTYFQHHDMSQQGLSAQGVLERARDLVGGTGTLLDIGAGRGELLRVARDMGWQAIGIETSATFADFAARNSGADIRQVPLAECKFLSSSFDVVILVSVLEHLYNPDETIREISRILRPGGALILDVPNERGLYFRIGNLYQRMLGRAWVVNLSPTFSPYHLFGFSPRALRTLLAKHGLRPTDWHVYPGTAMVPSRGGILGTIEQAAAHAVTALSHIGEMGTYISTWAIKD